MKSVKTFFESRTSRKTGFYFSGLMLVGLCLASQSYAKSGSIMSIQVGDRKVAMIEVPERHMMISEGCKKGERFDCQAYSVFMRIKKDLKEETKTPPEVGADLCASAHGAIKIGTTASKDEITLCYFAKDRSYIDVGSLYARTQGY